MSPVDPVPHYTLRQLAAFVAVAEWGSIAGAADVLSMSQSAVSSSITELERALGARLCIRQRARGVRLTPTGEGVLERARILLHQAGELQADARAEAGEVVGRVKVGCYPSLGPTVLPALLDGFIRSHPRVHLDFHEDDQNHLTAQLESGELDVAVMYALDLRPGLGTVTIGQRNPMVLLPAAHPLAAGDEPIRLQDLGDAPMVLLDSPPSSSHGLGVCRTAGFTPNVVYRTRNFETSRAFVGRGLGWTLLLSRPRRDITYEGFEIAVRDVTDPVPAPVDVVVAWKDGALLSRAAREFLTFAAGSIVPSHVQK
ncbi:LysR substrate-binding domain-containing protein [Rhodococcus zopfii]|uniref:LysR substrate-binding domain-containing protein n=1 Tax=Rhodococcus zopfii TaxID=43772 RepID=UPI000932E08B|nr:LysR substrate-binding domain-containing protein [Rhodococcus zopfii]